MLDVTVKTKVTRPEYQVFSSRVQLYGFDKLTPRAARAALEIAGYHTGEAWCTEWVPQDGGGYYKNSGYRVYGNSARKIYDHTY